MKVQRLFLCVLLVWLLLPTITVSAKGFTVEGKVIKVKDGDTVVIAPIDRHAYFTCRLYGIDAPEISHGRKRGQPYGTDAARELKRLILGKTVEVEATGEKTFHREVCRIRVDAIDVNLEMVRLGYAWAYRKYLKRPHASEYIDAEGEARASHLGLWQDANPVPPWEFRKKTKRKRMFN